MNKKLTLFGIFICGSALPFTPFGIAIFFFLPPLLFVFFFAVIYLIAALFSFKNEIKNALFLFIFLSIFILSQIISVVTVDKIQRMRSKKIIESIYQIKKATGFYPQKYNISWGITYTKIDENEFALYYSRGFLVLERYNSKNNEWKSYGWND